MSSLGRQSAQNAGEMEQVRLGMLPLIDCFQLGLQNLGKRGGETLVCES